MGNAHCDVELTSLWVSEREEGLLLGVAKKMLEIRLGQIILYTIGGS